jgi:hypothetical protein
MTVSHGWPRYRPFFLHGPSGHRSFTSSHPYRASRQIDWPSLRSCLVIFAVLVMLIRSGVPSVGPQWARTTLSGHEPPRRSVHRLISMFRCQLCQCVVPPRTPCQHVVVKRRSKEYPYRSRANTFVRTNEPGKRKEYHTDDPGGGGQEAVQEVIAHLFSASNGPCSPRRRAGPGRTLASAFNGAETTSGRLCLTSGIKGAGPPRWWPPAHRQRPRASASTRPWAGSGRPERLATARPPRPGGRRQLQGPP